MLESALGLVRQAADDLATLRAEFEEFTQAVERALADVRSASPEDIAKLGELVERIRSRVLPND